MEEKEAPWVDSFIDQLQGIQNSGGKVTVKDALGNPVLVKIGSDMLTFLLANKIYLQQVSLSAFKEFLGLMAQQKSFEALTTIYSQLDNSALLEKYKEDTIKLAEIARQAQEARDFWIAFCKQAGEKLLFSALGALL